LPAATDWQRYLAKLHRPRAGFLAKNGSSVTLILPVQRLGVTQQDVDLAVMLRVITILWLPHAHRNQSFRIHLVSRNLADFIMAESKQLVKQIIKIF